MTSDAPTRFKVVYRGGDATRADADALWREATQIPDAVPDSQGALALPGGAWLGAEEIVLTIIAGPIAQVVVDRLADWVIRWAKARAQAKRAHRTVIAVKLGTRTLVMETAADHSSDEIQHRAKVLREEMLASSESSDSPR